MATPRLPKDQLVYIYKPEAIVNKCRERRSTGWTHADKCFT